MTRLVNWKTVCDYPDYEISTDGQIKSLDRIIIRNGNKSFIKGRLMKQQMGKFGYLLIGLRKNGVPRTERVNVLMGKTFLDKDYISKGLVTNHKNGVKSDNRLENLEIVTWSENNLHARKTGLNQGSGIKHHCAKLTDEDIETIRFLFSEGKTANELSEKYKVTGQHIRDIVKFKKRYNKYPTFQDYLLTLKK